MGDGGTGRRPWKKLRPFSDKRRDDEQKRGGGHVESIWPRARNPRPEDRGFLGSATSRRNYPVGISGVAGGFLAAIEMLPPGCRVCQVLTKIISRQLVWWRTINRNPQFRHRAGYRELTDFVADEVSLTLEVQSEWLKKQR